MTEDKPLGEYVHYVPLGSKVTGCGAVIPDGWPRYKGLITCPACRQAVSDKTQAETEKGRNAR